MRFELKNKEFYQKTVILMLPAMLQQLITVGINFLDNLMIGGFGETQIAAVAFGNQFYALFQFVCMGLGSGAVVMSSQFWGRKELDPMRATAAMALRVTVAFCGVFTVIAACFPGAIMRFYTSEAAVVQVGTPYMRLIGLTFLLSGLSSTATYLLRSVGNVRISLIGSSVAFVLNLFFNWVFIFGKLGAPRLELVGAAVGTIIARIFEFCFVFGFFVFKDRKFTFRLKHFALPGGALRQQYVKFSVPVLISDTLLGISLTLTSVIVGHVGENLAAANSIVGTAAQLITILNTGMAGASAVVIGNTIGAGDIPKAKREANTYILISMVFGAILIPIFLLLARPYLSCYNITDETWRIAMGMIYVTCGMLPIQNMAYVTSKGILRGGGDTKFLLFADSTLVWFVSIPLGALAGLVWHMDPIWVYFFLRVEFPAKGIVCLIRYLTGKWIKVISAKGSGEEVKQA